MVLGSHNSSLCFPEADHARGRGLCVFEAGGACQGVWLDAQQIFPKEKSEFASSPTPCHPPYGGGGNLRLRERLATRWVGEEELTLSDI